MSRSLGSMNDDASLAIEVKIGEGSAGRYTVLQLPRSLNHGCALWDSAVGFAKFLAFSRKHAESFRGRAVLELGSGTGFLGCVLQRAGVAALVCTDLASVMDNAAACVAANDVPCIRLDACASAAPCEPSAVPPRGPDAAPLRRGAAPLHLLEHAWGSSVCPLFALACPYDFILGTDVMYSASLVPLLLRSIALAAWISDHADDESSSGGGGGGASSAASPERWRVQRAVRAVSQAELRAGGAALPAESVSLLSGGGGGAGRAAEAADAAGAADAGVAASSSAVASAASAACTRCAGEGEAASAPSHHRRKRCTVYLANEVRCTATHAAFLALAELLFEPVRLLPKRLVGPEVAAGGVLIFELKLRPELAPGDIIRLCSK